MADTEVVVVHEDAVLRIFIVPLDEEGIQLAVINLDRESKTASSVNIIDEEFALSLARTVVVLALLAREGSIDCVVLCSSKENSFVAGADIKYEVKMKDASKIMEDCRKINYGFCGLEGLPVPTVCILNGTTLGGGLELALSCDYRIADVANCREIGFPEVKIGVLPGAGGCIRLPRLLHLKDAVQMIASGQTVNSKAATKLGLVDALFAHTSSHSFSSGEAGGMKLSWMKEFRQCISQGCVGRRPFHLKKQSQRQTHTNKVSITPKIEEIFAYNRDETEHLINADLVDEKKFQKKFPLSFLQSNSLSQGIIFTLAKRSVQQSVGRRMPAPYGCLETMASCLKMATLKEAIDATAEGFSKLVVTAESKCLMGLFLQTRKMRKEAEMLVDNTETAATLSDVHAGNTCVVIPIACGEEQNPSCLAQSCIHSGIRVVIVEVETGKKESSERPQWRGIVEEEFDYAVKRGHWTKEKVDTSISTMVTSVKEDDFFELVSELPSRVFVMTLHASVAPCARSLVEMLNGNSEYKGQVYVVAVDDGAVLNTLDGIQLVCVGLFSPLRRSTQAVEVYANQHSVASDVKAVACLFKMLHKLPLVSNMCGVAMETILMVDFWLSCCELVRSSGQNRSEVDRVARIVSGFQRGPFEAIKSFGSGNLKSLCGCADRYVKRSYNSFDVLQGSTSFQQREPRKAPLTEEDVDLYLKVACVKAAMSVKNLSTLQNTVKDSLLDVLCVAGMIRFPPQEGGPLCFAYRNGTHELKHRLAALGHKAQHLNVVSSLVSALHLQEQHEEEYNKAENVFQWEDLYSAGRCHGAGGPYKLPVIPWLQVLTLIILMILYAFYMIYY